jgi:hypothetical protein
MRPNRDLIIERNTIIGNLQMSRRIIVTIGDEKIVIDDVPACVPCRSLKQRIAQLDLGIPDDFEIASNSVCYADDELVVTDEISVVPQEKKRDVRTDFVVRIIFWCVHMLPLYCLASQKRIWQIAVANLLGMILFGIMRIIRSHDWKSLFSGNFVPSRNLTADLGTLFMKSLAPSFRIEHLLSAHE